MTVLAVADGSHQPRQLVLEKLHDKTSGLGLVRFDKPNRKITVECWPLLADVTKPDTQFRGWPLTFDMQDSYRRRADWQLPRLEFPGIENAVVEVRDENSGELVYVLRMRQRSWQPLVFAPGKYTVSVSLPETGMTKNLCGLEAVERNETQLEIWFERPIAS